MLLWLVILEICTAGSTNHRGTSLQYSASHYNPLPDTKLKVPVQKKRVFLGLFLVRVELPFSLVQAFLQHPVFTDTANDVTTFRAAQSRLHLQEQ